MAAYNKFNSFVEDVAEKVHNLQTDVLKIMLTNAAPVASNTVKANLTDIGAGFGYTAGGTAVTITASSQTAGVYSLVGSNVVFNFVATGTGLHYQWQFNKKPLAGANNPSLELIRKTL